MSEQSDINRGLLKDKLGNYQVDPPEKVWDAISDQINHGRKRRGMYILLLATAASIALAVSLGIHFMGPDLPQQQAHMEESGMEQDAAMVPEDVTPDIQETGEVMQMTLAVQQIDVNDGDATVPAHREQAIELAEKEEDVSEPESSGIPKYAAETEAAAETETEAENDQLAKLLTDSAFEISTDPFPLMEEAKKKDPRWMVGAAVSPLYSYRNAEDMALPSNPGESGLLSYSTGVHVSYRRHSRLAIETGLYFNRTGIAIGAPGIRVFSQSYDNMIFGVGSETADITSINNSVGNIVAHSGDIFMNGYKISAESNVAAFDNDAVRKLEDSDNGIEQHLDYLELPFNLRYSLVDRTFELQLVGGVSTNFLVGNSVTMEGPSGKEEIGYLTNVNTVNYSGNAGLGMIYHMGKNLNLTLEPRFRYFINSVNDSSLPSTRPYSLGFYTGLSYTF